MASTQHPISTSPETLGTAGFGPRTQCRESRLVVGPALFRIWHATSGYDDTRSATRGRKTVDNKPVINPRAKVMKGLHIIQPQCTLLSTPTPIHHEPITLDATNMTHNTRIQAPILNTAPLTRNQTPTVVCIRTTLYSSSQVLKPLALGNAASQLAKHKQVCKWAAERALSRTDLSWSRSRMPTLVPLLDVQHLIPHQVRDAAKFTAGTVLESAKGGPLFLGCGL